MILHYTSTPIEGQFCYECADCGDEGWAPCNSKICHLDDCKGPIMVKQFTPIVIVLPCTKFSEGGSVTVQYKGNND